MIEANQNPDNQSRFEIPPRLRGDLHALFEPDSPVPPQIDRAVMDRARRRLAPRQRHYRLVRWAASAAAAAAVITFVFMLDHTHQRGQTARQLAQTTIRADIDLNGRVDILDAFKLARQIESTEQPQIQWDINRDGLVNRDDVDYVAFAAVRLDKGV